MKFERKDLLGLEDLTREEIQPTDGAVVVERDHTEPEMFGDLPKDRDDNRLAQKREQAIGDNHRRPIAGNPVDPVGFCHGRRNRVRPVTIGQHSVAQLDDGRQIHAVPVHR